MKQFAYVTGMAFTMIMCIGIPSYLGYKYHHVVIGIFLGFIFAMLYLFKVIMGKGE
ncbi:MAG: hypothetical protein PUD22_06685 [Erysipelotrichaceae bacterium]|nr:hypothetical protein [Erysipelotrichaceae bacterium]